MTNTYFPALPNAVTCLTPAIDVLVDNPANTRPGHGNGARLDHINYGAGHWSDVLTGWLAQATLNFRRVSDEMLQARLPLASGQGLRELVSSKFLTNIVDVPTKAIGRIQLNGAWGAPLATGGVIPAGTRFRRNANPAAVPIPILGADFISLVDIVVPTGAAPGANFYIPIQCVQTGPAGNIVIEAFGNSPGTDLQVVDQLFQPFTVARCTCAGGGTSLSDFEVRQIATAQPQGRRGATEGALVAGAFLATGVRHVAVFEDLTNAQSVIFMADESWTSDATFWLPGVLQSLIDNAWAGFGCVLAPVSAYNAGGGQPGEIDTRFLNINATVQLRSGTFLANTAAIKAAIELKLTDYFDSRPDWYTFRTLALQGVIARAHPNILTCTSVTITDRFGTSVTDPPAVPYGTLPSSVFHYSVLSFNPTFSAPI